MSFKIDASQVKKLARFAADVPDAVARAEFRAVNKVAEKATTRSKTAITGIVALTPTYVSDRMFLTRALLGKPVALITARTRPTKLFTYGAKQLTAPAPRAKGDPSRGIPAGRKAAGIAAGFKAGGGKKPIPNAFLMRLRSDNGFGVFTREGNRLRHRYGPSVDQTFRLVISDIKDDVATDLEQTYAAQLDYELKGIK